MSSESRQLHVVFFPFMSAGHTIPMLDMVCLFTALDHIKSTIITTPRNAPNITKSLENCITSPTSSIGVHVIPFPSHEAGLPDGVENLAQVTSMDMSAKFIFSTKLLKYPVERFLEESKPDCLVADSFFPFATEVAAKFGVPRLVFRGIGFFAACATTVVEQYEPHKLVLSDDEPFIIPTLPHEVKLTKSQMSVRDENNDMSMFFRGCDEAGLKSYGEVFNSFYELEPDYVDYYRKVLNRRGWHIGPVSLSKRRIEKSLGRVVASLSINEHKCLEWLDSKDDNSVIYVCFGSGTKFSGPQLEEIATALERSGEEFIWVVNKSNEGGEHDELLLDGFEKRLEGKGLIMRGWAPQVLILEHRAVGGFVTHCGWNSTLEGISAGVPMVTWPVFAEQFYNEKLITDVLRVGVQVGSKHLSDSLSEAAIVKRERIEVALKGITEGNEAFKMRSRAKKLKELANEAPEEGGSSYNELRSLIQELRSL